MPIPMQVFQSWFCACHVDLLADRSRAQRYLDLFPCIQGMPRAEQKRGVAACIEHFSHDPAVSAHPETEPLVIDS